MVIGAAIAGDGLVGLLVHELQHAVEVADVPWVVTTDAFRALYREIGRRWSENCAAMRPRAGVNVE